MIRFTLPLPSPADVSVTHTEPLVALAVTLAALTVTREEALVPTEFPAPVVTNTREGKAGKLANDADVIALAVTRAIELVALIVFEAMVKPPFVEISAMFGAVNVLPELRAVTPVAVETRFMLPETLLPPA